MKKYVIKATALAIGALVGGAAVASVDFTADPVATTGLYAKELNYNSTGTGSQVIASAGGNSVVTTKLGFGVSATQLRYIRVDLGGIKLAAAAAGTDVVNTTAAFGAGNVTVVSGGSVGDSFIIYQVTGNAGGHAASNVLTITVPDVNTTAGNAANPTVTYALYETAVAAANNVAGSSLYSTSGTLFKFGAGYTVTATPYTNTALVTKSYKQFSANGATPTTTAGKAEIGTLTIAASAAKKGTGGAIAVSDIMTSGSKIVFKGDFTSANNTDVTVEAAGCAGAIAGSTTTVAADKQSATWTAGTNGNLITAMSLCFPTDNTVAIPAQVVTYDLNPTAVSGNTVADPAADTIGTILRDGTELQAPFATIHPDYLSRVVLTSQHSLDAAYTLSVIAEDGVTCAAGPAATGTLKKGAMAVINVKDICPSTNTGATRLAVKAVIAAPLSTVHGLYNVMNYDVTTGKTNSLISYPMVRPTEN